MEEDWNVSLSAAGISASVTIVLPRKEMVFGQSLCDLRRLKDISIPEGTKAIDGYLFWNSGIESLTVPASVSSI